jgi:ribosomal protein S18 acetylase RimI-like enzyme
MVMTMREIRRADADEAELIAELAAEIWTEHYTGLLPPAQIPYMLERFQSAAAIREQIESGCCYELALEDGVWAGYCASRLDEDALFISKLYLRRACRGRKIARHFLERLISRAQAEKKPVIRLLVHKKNPTLTIYHRLGFTVKEALVTDIGAGFILDDYRMELAVPRP